MKYLHHHQNQRVLPEYFPLLLFQIINQIKLHNPEHRVLITFVMCFQLIEIMFSLLKDLTFAVDAQFNSPRHNYPPLAFVAVFWYLNLFGEFHKQDLVAVSLREIGRQSPDGDISQR